jgi:dTMP kinase
VIADRYTTSNAIHQCSKLDQGEWDGFLQWLFDFEYEKMGIPQPNLVVYHRVDPEVSQALMLSRYDGDEARRDIHEKDLAYLRRCQSAADYCARRLGWTIVECCEGGGMRSIESIQAEIMGHVLSTAEL